MATGRLKIDIRNGLDTPAVEGRLERIQNGTTRHVATLRCCCTITLRILAL